HPLLDQVVRVAARQEVGARLQPHEAVVAAQQLIHGGLAAVPGLEHELEVLELALGLLGRLRRGRCAGCHRFSPWNRTVSCGGESLRSEQSLTLKSREKVAGSSTRYNPFAQIPV